MMTKAGLHRKDWENSIYSVERTENCLDVNIGLLRDIGVIF
jgi:hypothetical protein